MFPSFYWDVFFAVAGKPAAIRVLGLRQHIRRDRTAWLIGIVAVQSGLVAEPRIEQTLLRLGQVLMPSLTVSVVVQPLAAAKLRHLLAPFVGQDVALALQEFDGLFARKVKTVDAFRCEPAPLALSVFVFADHMAPSVAASAFGRGHADVAASDWPHASMRVDDLVDVGSVPDGLRVGMSEDLVLLIFAHAVEAVHRRCDPALFLGLFLAFAGNGATVAFRMTKEVVVVPEVFSGEDGASWATIG